MEGEGFRMTSNCTALWIVLVLVLGQSATARQDDAGVEPKIDEPSELVVELTEPRPKRTEGSELPKGWTEERLARAGGLYFKGDRTTVGELMSTISKSKVAGRKVLILAYPLLSFQRLTTVVDLIRRFGEDLGEISFAASHRPRRRHPCLFVSGFDLSFLFKDGNIVVQGELEELIKKQNKERVRINLFRNRLGPADDSANGATEYRVGAKAIDGKNRTEKLARVREALIAAIKEAEGDLGARLNVTGDVPVEEIVDVCTMCVDVGLKGLEFQRPFGFERDSSHMSAVYEASDPKWVAEEIEAGLEALSRRQSDLGEWFGGEHGHLDSVGRTGLALLAFLGEFHTPDEGAYKNTVRQGLDYLKLKQRKDGCITGGDAGYSINHAIATYALAEAYGVTGSESYEDCAQRALNFISKCRNSSGAWGISSGVAEPDLLVTSWSAMALRSGEDSGLGIPDDSWSKLEAWLATIVDLTTARVDFGSKEKPRTRVGHFVDDFFGRHPESLTAVAAIARTRTGATIEDDEVLLAMTERVLQHPPGVGSSLGPPDLDFLFFGALAMNDIGSSAWQPWRESLDGSVLQAMIRLRGRGTVNFFRNRRGSKDLESADPAALAMLTLCMQFSYRYGQSFEAPR